MAEWVRVEAFELGYVISNPSSAVVGDWACRPTSATNLLSLLESYKHKQTELLHCKPTLNLGTPFPSFLTSVNGLPISHPGAQAKLALDLSPKS